MINNHADFFSLLCVLSDSAAELFLFAETVRYR